MLFHYFKLLTIQTLPSVTPTTYQSHLTTAQKSAKAEFSPPKNLLSRAAFLALSTEDKRNYLIKQYSAPKDLRGYVYLGIHGTTLLGAHGLLHPQRSDIFCTEHRDVAANYALEAQVNIYIHKNDIGKVRTMTNYDVNKLGDRTENIIPVKEKLRYIITDFTIASAPEAAQASQQWEEWYSPRSYD